MRILQICAAYKPAYIYGGPTMSVSMLSEQLVKAGIATDVFTTTANGKKELPVVPGATVNVEGVSVTYFTRITKDHSHFSPALAIRLWKTIKQYDLVHIHAWWNLVSLFSCSIALIRRVPVLVAPRGTLSPYSFQNKNIGPKWAIHHLFGKHLLNKSFIHVTSKREYDAVSCLVKPKGMIQLPNFIKFSAYKPSREIPFAPYIRLLFLSRIEEKKGLDILIEALAHVTVPYRLTIAGDGDETYTKSLKMMAQTNNTAGKIDWIGFQSENKFQLLYENDLFVLPSYDENFGNSVIESLSMGTAVLISEQVGLADYVEENKLGWICKTNPQSISDAINFIVTEEGELSRIKKQAPVIIDDDFQADKLVNRYISSYSQLVETALK